MLTKAMVCECIICDYWYLIEINFRFQPKVCDGCQVLIQKAVSFNDTAIVSVKSTDSFLYIKTKQHNFKTLR